MGMTANTFAMFRVIVPDREQHLKRRYWSDAEFRTLCRDYRTCHEILQRLEYLDSPDATRRRHEYAELLEELACEIRNWPDDRPGLEVE